MSVSALPTVNRVSGPAPLTVLAHGINTFSTRTSNPFEDVQHEWNYGDPGSGNYAYGSQGSRNTHRAGCSAHCYQTPGTYYLTYLAFDGVDWAVAVITITVTDPDTFYAGAATIAVSASGNFAGAPAGSTHVTQADFVTALNANVADNTRVLFRDADTFSTSGTHTLPRNLVGATVGSWGGGKAAVNYTGAGTLIQPPNNGTVVQNDNRFMDLNVDMGSAANSRFFNTDNSGTSTLTRFTFLRIDVAHMNIGIEAAPTNLYELGVFDCTFSGMVGANGYGTISQWQDAAWMGNNFTGMNSSATSHNCRFGMAIRGVFAFNSSDDGVSGMQSGHLLKLHALAGGVTYSEYVTVADNKFSGGHAGTVWYVNISPQNSASIQLIRHVVVERNWFVDGANAGKLLRFHASLCTARNNRFNSDTATQPICVEYEGSGPVSDGNWIYNNSAYKSTGGSNFAMVNIDATATNTTVRNNLGYAPAATSPVFMTNAGTGTVSSNNSTDSQVKNNTPLWTSPASGDFTIASGSYARDAGFSVPVFEDYLGGYRPQTSASWDIGADEFDVGTIAPWLLSTARNPMAVHSDNNF